MLAVSNSSQNPFNVLTRHAQAQWLCSCNLVEGMPVVQPPPHPLQTAVDAIGSAFNIMYICSICILSSKTALSHLNREECVVTAVMPLQWNLHVFGLHHTMKH